MKIWRNILIGWVICMILTACFPAAPAPTATPTPAMNSSEEFITAAWDAYNANQYSQSIDLARECVDRWEIDAVDQQSMLTEEPLNGKVTKEEEQKIFENWAVNDVSTAYYIIGSSLEKLGKPTEAKQSYEKVLEFAYGRCWDPQGWFWSPAVEARKRISKLP